MTFDPNCAADEGSGVFGLPYSEKESALVLLPVPWEATTSYGGGTARGPAAILKASEQVDLYDADVLKPYEAGIFMRPIPKNVIAWNKASKTAETAKVNLLSDKVNDWVYEQTRELLKEKKIVGLVGGDHSTPYGAIKAASEKFPELGLLHFDAHHDLRIAYQGFKHSHASILYNVMKDCPGVGRLVQVGVRDFCEQEVEVVKGLGGRITVFYDNDLQRQKFAGSSWNQQVEAITNELPANVWTTFDIDGLDARFCPNTGTPVPGGLDFQEANHVLRAVARSGRKIVGFDLNEVSPGLKGSGDWDANVGARLLYKLCAWTLASQGRAALKS